jgi:hypothetical protein
MYVYILIGNGSCGNVYFKLDENIYTYIYIWFGRHVCGMAKSVVNFNVCIYVCIYIYIYIYIYVYIYIYYNIHRDRA